MTQDRTVLLVGGPDSGKTNFLGKLWLTINNKRGKLIIDVIPDDLSYLNEIAHYYNQGKFAPHTASEVRNKVFISVKGSDESLSNLHSKLIIPDVSGEEWIGIFKKRGWSDQWEQIITFISGCLIFIRVESDVNVPALDWLSWSKVFNESQQKKYEIPTQVILVDWIQFLLNTFVEKNSHPMPRIAVIVAAYDLLPDDQKAAGPDNYLKENFPLFWQYIHAINLNGNIKVFGTSIASGDFEKDKIFQKQFLSNPNDAGYVIFETEGEITESNDLSLPIVWTLGNEFI